MVFYHVMNEFFTENYINLDCNYGLYNIPDAEIDEEERSINCILHNIIHQMFEEE